MIRWALASLLADRGSVFGSAAGVGTALVLVVVIQAVFAGESEQIVSYIDHSGADVWVLQDGVSNVHMATSIVSRSELDDVRRVPGVAAVVPLHYVNATVQSPGSPSWFAYLVGVPAGAPFGGPWSLATGSAAPGIGEVVIPVELARRDGVELGGELLVAGRPMRIVGLTEGAFSMANSLLFVSRQDAITIAGSGSPNYLLVRPDPEVRPEDLAGRIRSEVPGVNAVSRADLRVNDFRIAIQMGGELILIMLFIGAGVATLTITWTVASFVSRHAGELAVAKAVGARQRDIVASVVALTTTVALLGFALAVAVAIALEPFLRAVAPDVVVRVQPGDVAALGGVTLVVCLLSAALPARRVLALDPAQVFS